MVLLFVTIELPLSETPLVFESLVGLRYSPELFMGTFASEI